VAGEGTVRVEGLSGLRRAFKAASAYESKQLLGRLKDAAEPVKVDAQGLATSTIKASKIDWTQMRVGILRHSVYVAPVQRGGKGSRRGSKFATRVMNNAMLPALHANRDHVVEAVDELLKDTGRVWETVP